jgi:hypothetical protein
VSGRSRLRQLNLSSAWGGNIHDSSFHCTVSVIVMGLLRGDGPEDVAVIVTMVEPTGVPEFWLVTPPLPVLALTPQAVHQIVESSKALTRPSTRTFPGLRLPFLFTNTMPTKPGSNNA